MEPIDLNRLKRFSKDHPVKQIFHESEHLRMALLCMEAGQEVPPHAAPSGVMIQVLEGEGEFTLGEEVKRGSAGTIFTCPPNVPHGVRARTRLTVLATVAPRPEPKGQSAK
jgi:quercetin dioxygenase-like cupin family protein